MSIDIRIQDVPARSLLAPIQPRSELEIPAEAGKSIPPAQGPSFGDVLKDSINEVTRLQQEAEKAQTDLITGQNRDVHGTMIAMQKAGVSFKLMMEVRSKIVDAYKEVMRMQV
ncbi:MAG: flagellar hook-basal body complex protein FliE [Candidatus Sumerlaeota bacterium]|nr:flagellar hook-basal body complex protein FliE [Candidatus Sumerlaeota bacterium]